MSENDSDWRIQALWDAVNLVGAGNEQECQTEFNVLFVDTDELEVLHDLLDNFTRPGEQEP